MSVVQILYIILGASIVIITVTIVWLANETIGLIKSLRRSSENTEVVTRELKEKVLVVSEALDRAGTAASTLIGLFEDGMEAIKERRDQVVNAISVVAGTGKYISKKKEEAAREDREESSAISNQPSVSDKNGKDVAESDNEKEETSDTKKSKEKEEKKK